MTKLPKFFLTVSLTAFAVGTIVCFGIENVPPSWMVAMPVGAVFFGLFLNAYLLQGEAARFDEEETQRKEKVTRGAIMHTPKREGTFASGRLQPRSAGIAAE